MDRRPRSMPTRCGPRWRPELRPSRPHPWTATAIATAAAQSTAARPRAVWTSRCNDTRGPAARLDRTRDHGSSPQRRRKSSTARKDWTSAQEDHHNRARFRCRADNPRANVHKHARARCGHFRRRAESAIVMTDTHGTGFCRDHVLPRDGPRDGLPIADGMGGAVEEVGFLGAEAPGYSGAVTVGSPLSRPSSGARWLRVVLRPGRWWDPLCQLGKRLTTRFPHFWDVF